MKATAALALLALTTLPAFAQTQVQEVDMDRLTPVTQTGNREAAREYRNRYEAPVRPKHEAVEVPGAPALPAANPNRAAETRREIEDFMKRPAKMATDAPVAEAPKPAPARPTVDESIGFQARLIAVIVALTVLGALGVTVWRTGLRRGPQRAFAVALIAIGSIVAVASFPIADKMTSDAALAWYDDGIKNARTTGQAGFMLEMIQHGKFPAHLAVSPLPGVFGGLGTAALGIILIALDRNKTTAAVAPG